MSSAKVRRKLRMMEGWGLDTAPLLYPHGRRRARTTRQVALRGEGGAVVVDNDWGGALSYIARGRLRLNRAPHQGPSESLADGPGFGPFDEARAVEQLAHACGERHVLGVVRRHALGREDEEPAQRSHGFDAHGRG
jgi:hypothetical protein